MDYMDHRRSSLSYGPRTKKYVIRDKVIRKHDDGTDVFADYWTDEESNDSISTKASFRSNRNETPLRDFNHLSPNTEQNVHSYTTRSISSRRKMVDESFDKFNQHSCNSESLIKSDGKKRIIKPAHGTKFSGDKLKKSKTLETQSNLSRVNLEDKYDESSSIYHSSPKSNAYKQIDDLSLSNITTINTTAAAVLSDTKIIQNTRKTINKEPNFYNALLGSTFNVEKNSVMHNLVEDECQESSNAFEHLPQNSEASIPITDSSLSKTNKKGRMQKDIPQATINASATGRLSEIDLIQRTTYSHDRQETEESGLQNTLPGNTFNVSNLVLNNDAQVSTHSISVDKQHKVRKISDILGKSKDNEEYDKCNADMLELLNSYYEGENSQVESHLHEDKAVLNTSKSSFRSNCNENQIKNKSSNTYETQNFNKCSSCEEMHEDDGINKEETSSNFILGKQNSANKLTSERKSSLRSYDTDDGINKEETSNNNSILGKQNSANKLTSERNSSLRSYGTEKKNLSYMKDKNELQSSLNIHKQSINSSSRIASQVDDDCNDNDSDISISTTEVNENKVSKTLPENFEGFAADDEMSALVDNSETCVDKRKKSRKSTFSKSIHKRYAKSLNTPRVDDDCDNSDVLTSENEMNKNKKMRQNLLKSNRFIDNANMPSLLYNKDTCTDKVPENLSENFERFADDDKMPTLVDFRENSVVKKNKNRKSVKSSKIPKSAKKSASNYQVSKSESRIVFLVDDEEKDVSKALYKNKKLSEIFPKNIEKITDDDEISAVVNNENTVVGRTNINKKSLISSRSIQEKDDKAANNSKGTKQCVTNVKKNEEININKILAKDSVLNNRSSHQIDDDDVSDVNEGHYVSTNGNKNEKVHVNLAKDFEEKSGKKKKIRNTFRKSKLNEKFDKYDIDILEMLNNRKESENSKSKSFLKNIDAINTSKSSAAFMSSNKSPAKSNYTTVSDSQNLNAPSSSKVNDADDGRNRPETTDTSTLGNKSAHKLVLKRKSVRNNTSPKTLLLRNKDKTELQTSLKSRKHYSKSSGEIASQMDDDKDVPSDTNENSLSKTSENFKRLADDEEMPILIDNRETCVGKTNKKRKSVITSKSIHENVTKSASNNQKTKKCNTSAKEKDENVENNLNLLRRSTRRRFPRLAGWRRERPIYRIENGIIKFVRLDEGGEEDDYAVKCLLKRSMAKKVDKNKISRVKKLKLDDVVNKKKINITLLKRFNLTPWDENPPRSNNSYRIKKTFQTHCSSFGFIEIEVSKEKPLQYMPGEDLYLTVVKGKIEVTVQDNQCILELKDSIVVPRSIPYSLKNIGNVKALLVYCVGKFDYIDSSY